jgi:hypothetical protein
MPPSDSSKLVHRIAAHAAAAVTHFSDIDTAADEQRKQGCDHKHSAQYRTQALLVWIRLAGNAIGIVCADAPSGTVRVHTPSAVNRSCFFAFFFSVGVATATAIRATPINDSYKSQHSQKTEVHGKELEQLQPQSSRGDW